MKARFLRPQVNTVGLIGHWKLDGSGFDYSLNGRAGTLTGTLPTYQYPGVDLPGTDEYIAVDDDTAFSPILSPLSISAWVNMDSATNFVIVSKYNTAATTREWLFYCQAADKLLLQVWDETTDKHVTRTYNTALSTGKWLHVAAVYDGTVAVTTTVIKLYLNGVRVDDTDSSDGPITSCRNTAVAVAFGLADGVYANGKVDDVMIFNLEKSAAEIKSIYEVTRRRYGG